MGGREAYQPTNLTLLDGHLALKHSKFTKETKSIKSYDRNKASRITAKEVIYFQLKVAKLQGLYTTTMEDLHYHKDYYKEKKEKQRITTQRVQKQSR